ncbi:NAD-dependent dehydratase [Bacillus coahuilensis m2-6]|uniref:NAD-dependent dehydratase n=1 Tax=Bacillus coahuilensis p1.1.43 TaxID=1150625 RepID=A0A147K6F2_9BACI|nr:SDR family oxidoreductase [Bacillus coahuilensis]KUP05367.1 NAD-dependent dehydratase [Bacillus coahuilensis p1.1.43]KUP06109.1 NAD-dependent dehydratase [Bacillus coahuilensis m2-6]
MNVLVIGANGTTGTEVVRLLGKSEDHTVYSMVRKEEQMEKMKDLGSFPILGDLEEDFDFAFKDIEAVIFAAGSGPHTGPDKTTAVDQNGAMKAVDYAKNHDIQHFIMLSSIGTDHPEEGPDEMQHYLKAKQKADQHLLDSGLSYTVIRPVSLTNDEATGLITAAKHLKDKRSEISRNDVAAALVAAIDMKDAHNKIVEISKGTDEIKEALKTA